MKPLRALIVEDSDADAELVLRALRRQGYDVLSRRVDTAEGMSAALREAPWDIVLSDYAMPEFSVTEALRILSEQDLDIPFIIISGSVGEELAVSAMKAGAHDFFLKDRMTRLGSAVERELGDANTRREKLLAMARLKESEQELRRAVEVRDEFLSIASHELRTPLTPLLLQLQASLAMIREARGMGTETPPEVLESRIEKATRHVERMNMLINSLLDVTRITSGPVVVSRSRVDLREVVPTLLRRLRESVRSGDVTLDAAEPVVGFWDPAGMESVIVNLLSNAFKYGDGKPILITLKRVGELAHLKVVDHGIGIAREEQQRIFERFERAVSPQHYGGFGIGLWVAAQVVKAHGGTIEVSSVKGEGSTFVVHLPIAGGEPTS